MANNITSLAAGADETPEGGFDSSKLSAESSSGSEPGTQAIEGIQQSPPIPSELSASHPDSRLNDAAAQVKELGIAEATPSLSGRIGEREFKDLLELAKEPVAEKISEPIAYQLIGYIPDPLLRESHERLRQELQILFGVFIHTDARYPILPVLKASTWSMLLVNALSVAYPSTVLVVTIRSAKELMSLNKHGLNRIGSARLIILRVIGKVTAELLAIAAELSQQVMAAPGLGQAGSATRIKAKWILVVDRGFEEIPLPSSSEHVVHLIPPIDISARADEQLQLQNAMLEEREVARLIEFHEKGVEMAKTHGVQLRSAREITHNWRLCNDMRYRFLMTRSLRGEELSIASDDYLKCLQKFSLDMGKPKLYDKTELTKFLIEYGVTVRVTTINGKSERVYLNIDVEPNFKQSVLGYSGKRPELPGTDASAQTEAT